MAPNSCAGYAGKRSGTEGILRCDWVVVFSD